MAAEVIPQESTRIPVEEWKQAARELKADRRNMESMFHRFPVSLMDLGKRYTDPLVVAIGPYHHGKAELIEMEKLKGAAAHRFIKDSGRSPEEIHKAVFDIAQQFRRFYVGVSVEVARMTADEFATMMLLDACFLLQYVRVMDADSQHPTDASLQHVFMSNRVCIENDIMLLENQIPWSMVQELNGLTGAPAPLAKFISTMESTFKINGHRQSAEPFLQYSSGHGLHLLALFRLEKIGRNRTGGVPESSSTAITASATELAKMAIKLKPCGTPDFMDMGIWTGKLSGNLHLAPLFLDETRACWLVNMAALEVCTASNEREDDIMKKKTAVCSYLALFAMLVNREEDVQELRTKRLVQANLTDKETLDFFKSIVKHIDGGRLYTGIMGEISRYKWRKKRWIKVHGFIKDNKKTIIAVLSIIAVLVGIFKTLLSIKTHQ
ncbi:hypothetical protein ZWY2020_031801 [Hordeum vulgare]|nr:hypothetical protein ZWY2020_031801 [Hordeum vulgare]